MRTCFIARYITIFLVVLGLTESNLAQSQDKLNGYEIETWLKKAMKMQPAVLFRSHGGQIYRTDSDTDIVFFANHKIVILDYGYGFTVSCGTYEVLTGNIKLHLIGARKKHPFPSLFMYQLQDRKSVV